MYLFYWKLLYTYKCSETSDDFSLVSVGCIRAYHKIILINEQDLHQSAPANIHLPRIHCQSKIFCGSCVCKRTHSRSTHTSVTLIHSFTPPPPLPSLPAAASRSNGGWLAPKPDAQKRDVAEIASAETRPPIWQCYHTLQKKKMLVLFRKTGNWTDFYKQKQSHH